MQIYNTLTRKKEKFHPINANQIQIYACGPTVYNYIHIGNARPLVVFDCLRRYLSYRGYEVKYVQNFTDVDDKIINKANQIQKTAQEVAKTFMKEYTIDAEGLNILPATVHPTVTQNIDVIIQMIQTLIEKGNAYVANHDVYFHTKSFSDYGKLSHMQLEDLEAGSRVEVNTDKKDPMDFALWKGAKENEPYWDSPWGKGRPGWHIECSAMATHYLSDTIDIHCGGQDLIFPHHENEIAQSEAATGVPFANYWMHNGYINVDNRKMSKSSGNFFTVREIAQKFGYEPIRFMMLQAHYRSPMNYSTEIIKQCQNALSRLYTFSENINFALLNAKDGKILPEDKNTIESKRTKFIEAMEDDFNTADAIAAIFELIRYMNPYVTGKITAGKEHLQFADKIFREMVHVTGLLYQSKPQETIPDDVQTLFEQRINARKEKNYQLADELRSKIESFGYAVEETRQGSKLIKK